MFFYLLTALTIFAISLLLARLLYNQPCNVKFLIFTSAALGAISSLLTAYSESIFVFYNVAWFIALFSGFSFADKICNSKRPKLMFILCLLCGLVFVIALCLAVINYINVIRLK